MEDTLKTIFEAANPRPDVLSGELSDEIFADEPTTRADPASERTDLAKQAMEESGSFTRPAQRKETA